MRPLGPVDPSMGSVIPTAPCRPYMMLRIQISLIESLKFFRSHGFFWLHKCAFLFSGNSLFSLETPNKKKRYNLKAMSFDGEKWLEDKMKGEFRNFHQAETKLFEAMDELCADSWW